MRGILQKHKKGVSELVSYTLLIIIAVAAAVLVYNYLKIYVPKDSPTCQDGISLVISDVKCNATASPDTLAVTVLNKGRFNIDAAYIRIGQQGKTTKTLVNGQNINDLYFIPSLSPEQSDIKMFNITSGLLASNTTYIIEIEPAVIDSTTKKLAACTADIISQPVQCS